MLRLDYEQVNYPAGEAGVKALREPGEDKSWTLASSADLWREYCSFYEKPFERQMEINETLLKEHLAKWGRTAQARILCPNGFQTINDIPLTSYGDYPVLLEFKKRIESLEKTSPRLPGELYWDYYERIGRIAAKPFSEYIIGDFSFVARSTGTVAEPKWVFHSSLFWENFKRDVVATTLLACSNDWGSTRFQLGDKGLNFTPSAPFLSGWGRKATQGVVVDVPPVEMMDEISDARRRFFIALQYLEKGHKVNLAGALAPNVYLMCEYFSNPEDLYREYYNSVNSASTKLYLAQKIVSSKLSNRSRNIRDYLDLKGLMIGGVDTALYVDYFRVKLGIEPFCIYGVTELGLPMFGSPDRKNQLIPNLRSCHFEFLNDKHELIGLKDIKVGETYKVVLTAFGGLFARYMPGDMVRVMGLRDDGMPIFFFWGRENAVIKIGRHPLITEAVATQVMVRAGLSLSDKWAFTKSFEGREKLLVLMENTWGLSEEEAAKRIFEALYSLVNNFRQYVKEYGIKNPTELIKVEYLKKGAFIRYSMKRARQGFPLGQIKPPKIIPSERQEITDLLREA
ncbi:MAG: GH3 auxin-responsive promoter family protein [Candidatus Brockarchaeota archaeon]|nr:GH3 auxin-responsive promoter family protein [Candidatus Brockarchaeota archaeon]MBO3808175.1 GH3 auxin-responsive promoter family protein [Candidatus Brockarchaeota archaeon]